TAIAVDNSGNAYVAGHTASTDFPTAGAPFQPTLGGGLDAFIAKLNPSGSSLLYSSYIGGSKDEKSWGLAVDAKGTAYAAGTTSSSNFRTTPGALRGTNSLIGTDVFVIKVQDVPLPSLQVDNGSLTFNYDLTGAAPGPQTVQITSSGAALAFTATT